MQFMKDVLNLLKHIWKIQKSIVDGHFVDDRHLKYMKFKHRRISLSWWYQECEQCWKYMCDAWILLIFGFMVRMKSIVTHQRANADGHFWAGSSPKGYMFKQQVWHLNSLGFWRLSPRLCESPPRANEQSFEGRRKQMLPICSVATWTLLVYSAWFCTP